MRELPWTALSTHDEEPRVRKLRFGHDGYAQIADGVESNNRGVAGESEISDEVSDAGETDDFDGMPMGLAKADKEVSDELNDDGESDASLLLPENIASRVAKRA